MLAAAVAALTASLAAGGHGEMGSGNERLAWQVARSNGARPCSFAHGLRLRGGKRPPASTGADGWRGPGNQEPLHELKLKHSAHTKVLLALCSFFPRGDFCVQLLQPGLWR